MRPNDLQLNYQRNMLHGLLLTCLLSVGFGAWVLSFGDNSRKLEPHIPAVSNVVVPDRGATDSSNQGTIRNVAGFNPFAARHEGFLGFIDLRPIIEAPTPTIEAQLVYSFELPPSEFDDNGASFSLSEGNDTGVYVSDDYSAVWDEFEPEPVLASRGIAVAHKIEPEYPFVAQEARKEGTVTVLVYVDSAGALAMFPEWADGEGIKILEFKVRGERRSINYAVREEPTDWFFASNVLRVLPEWRFIPKIERGRPVSSLLLITCNFCFDRNCLQFELEWLRS